MADIVTQMEDSSRAVLPQIDEYFLQNQKGESEGERIDRALKLISIYSRLRATRANEAAITLGIAKMMELKGEALAPLWGQLTGTDAKAFMQQPALPASDATTNG